VIYVEINTRMNLKNVFLYDFILNVDMSLIFFFVNWYMIVKCGVLF
jgi:hypothetical protein